MKNYIVMGLTALTLTVSTLASVHAADVMTLDEKMQAAIDGKSGVYSYNPIYDVGNIVLKKETSTAEAKVDCADMPCCKHKQMSMEECHKTMMGK